MHVHATYMHAQTHVCMHAHAQPGTYAHMHATHDEMTIFLISGKKNPDTQGSKVNNLSKTLTHHYF